MADKSYSRKGLFGDIIHYDEHGKKVGTLLRKLTQDPAPLLKPVFAQRCCVPHPQGVEFSPISQNR